MRSKWLINTLLFKKKKNLCISFIIKTRRRRWLLDMFSEKYVPIESGPLSRSITWTWLTAWAGVAALPGKVNCGQLNEAHHCSRRVFDLPAVGQNLSGESRPGPRLQFVSTQEGWQHKAEDVGGGSGFPRLPPCSSISTWPAHWRTAESRNNRY